MHHSIWGQHTICGGLVHVGTGDFLFCSLFVTHGLEDVSMLQRSIMRGYSRRGRNTFLPAASSFAAILGRTQIIGQFFVQPATGHQLIPRPTRQACSVIKPSGQETLVSPQKTFAVDHDGLFRKEMSGGDLDA